MHFKSKILKYLIIAVFIFTILKWFVFYKKSEEEKSIEFFLIFLCIMLWFISLPQLRFGSAFILIFSYYLLSKITNIGKLFKKKNFLIFLTIIVVYFNVSNLLRIKKEFYRNDLFKFNDFPYIAIPNYAFEDFFTEEGIIYRRYAIKNNNKMINSTERSNSYSKNIFFNVVRIGTDANFYNKNGVLYITNFKHDIK